MKKSLLLGAVFAFSLVAISTTVGAATIIDTLEDIGADGSIVSYRDIGGIGVNISVATGEPMRAFTYFVSDPWAFAGPSGVKNAPLNPDNLSGERFISGSLVAGFEINNPVIFDFSSPIQAFGLTAIGLLESGSPATNYLSLVGLDTDGNTVDAQTLTGAQGDLGVDLDFLVSSAINEITQVQLIGDITWLSGYGVDDLILTTAVPIPPAIWLFGSGLLGLIGIARKKAA
jgi:hypothetical protein